jgi:hypothetical protein
MEQVERETRRKRRQSSHADLATILIGCILCAQCAFGKSGHPQSYTDPQYRFRVACPDSGWTVSDETGIPEVLIVMKSEATAEDFSPNVTIAIEFLPRMMTAEEYGEKNREALTVQGYEMRSWRKTVIHHNTFYDLRCSNQNVSPPLRFRYLCLVKNRVGFIITCTAPERHDADYARDFEFIVNSFRFL